jgi:hypothetical protein
MSSSSQSISMSKDSSEVNDAFEQYRKTCSIIFGRTRSSQLRYLQSFIELQQSLLTSCNSTIAKQITWFEEYARKKNNKSENYLVLALEPFLRSSSAAIKAYMAMISNGLPHMIVNIVKKTLSRTYNIDMVNEYGE